MKHLAVLFAGFAISTAALQAQTAPSGVPDSHRPPPGMCRIWIDGVPPTHQPAPTDCATAIRKRPMNARVVFGSEAPAGSGRGFAPSQSGQTNFVAPSSQSHDDQTRIAQQREELERQRAAQLREEQERLRIEAQRQHDEQEKRAAHPNPPAVQHNQEHTAPRPRTDKTPRPPHQSYSAHRPR